MIEHYAVRRIAAKAIDVIAAFAIASLLSTFMGFFGLLVGMIFILFADLVGGGEGVGKRFFHLRVISTLPQGATMINWKQSLFRNLPFVVLLAFSSVALLGGLLGIIFGVPYCLFEIYLFANLQGRLRLGDVLASTSVREVGRGDDQ